MIGTSSDPESAARRERLLKEMWERWDRQDMLRAEQDEFFAEEFRRHVKMTKLGRKLLPFAVAAMMVWGGLIGYIINVWASR